MIFAQERLTAKLKTWPISYYINGVYASRDDLGTCIMQGVDMILKVGEET